VADVRRGTRDWWCSLSTSPTGWATLSASPRASTSPSAPESTARRCAAAPARRPSEQAAAGADLCRATVVLDGLARSFELEKGAVTILDAATREGLDLPCACKAGVCSTCRAMLVERHVDRDANHALEDYEVARGFVLTCQSYPVTDRIVVDFDK
jgi:ring-1,2-phenylacetyl-CoA epoxidase subunit PaaE